MEFLLRLARVPNLERHSAVSEFGPRRRSHCELFYNYNSQAESVALNTSSSVTMARQLIGPLNWGSLWL